MENINSEDGYSAISAYKTETDLTNLRLCTLRDCVIALNTDGTVSFINPQALQILHLEKDIPAGTSYQALFTFKYKDQDIFPVVLKRLSEKEPFVQYMDNLFVYETETGNYFPAISKITGLYVHGKLDKIVVLFLDVKEERKQSYFLNMTLNATHVFPWFFDRNRNVFVMTPEYFAYLGIPNHNNELTSEEFTELVHPDDRPPLFEALIKQISGSLYEAPVAFRLHKGDGTYEWMEGRSTHMAQEVSGLPYQVVGIVMSIQKIKDTEEEIARAKHNDEQKSAFLANMSHEIRTPLNAIVGFSNLLREMEDLEKEETNEFVGIINKNCDLLLSLINDILDLSKIESGTMEFHYSDESLNNLMQDIYNSQRLNMHEGVVLKWEKEEKDKVISVDPVRLKQVLNNLINNSVKFTSTGSITFGYHTRQPGQVIFFVKDTGKGISKENQKKIFDRFFKIDHYAQGVGLGLAICQTIVQHFQGTISIESEENVGTCFTVSIPETRSLT